MLACLFLGMGILSKTVPLILIPLLVGGLRRAASKVKFLGLVLLLGPVTMRHNICTGTCRFWLPHGLFTGDGGVLSW